MRLADTNREYNFYILKMYMDSASNLYMIIHNTLVRYLLFMDLFQFSLHHFVSFLFLPFYFSVSQFINGKI